MRQTVPVDARKCLPPSPLWGEGRTGAAGPAAWVLAILAFSVRRGTVPFAHRHSPKTPQNEY